MGVNSLPKTVTRQRLGCDLNPGPSAPESSTLTTRLLNHGHGQSTTTIQRRFVHLHQDDFRRGSDPDPAEGATVLPQTT